VLLRGGGKENVSLEDVDRIQLEIDGERKRKKGKRRERMELGRLG
jgi:hypothetical protein